MWPGVELDSGSDVARKVVAGGGHPATMVEEGIVEMPSGVVESVSSNNAADGGGSSSDNLAAVARKKASLARGGGGNGNTADTARGVFPEEMLEHVLLAITAPKDRNAVSLVCKSWNRVEQSTRRGLFIGNCYAVSPCFVTRRFPNLKSLSLKGKPRFSDFGLVPADWGAHALPWITALASAYPWFEEIRLKRMVITDPGLECIADEFPNFKSLVLTSCVGFSTSGLIPIASRCRHLAELELQECVMEETGGKWLSCFPDSLTSLIRLNFACMQSAVNVEALENLVLRCRSLQSLKVNMSVSLSQLERILRRAPQLTDLGTGSFTLDFQKMPISSFEAAIQNCKSLQSLSGFCEAMPACLPSIYGVCANLTSLNLSYASFLRSDDIIKLINNCPKLHCLWVLDYIEDRGLQAVASACKLLQELRVFPTDIVGEGQGCMTGEGLVAIAKGCMHLKSVLYFCGEMTNVALETVAVHSPQLTCFRLCILEPRKPDPATGAPLDEGFGSIIRACRNLRRFSLSGLLTDEAFRHIGTHGANLEMLSLAFAGESDKGLQYVLQGCPRLHKLEIRDCPFGDDALLCGMPRYENMRSLWMSSCKVTIDGCHRLAGKMPSLNVEIMKEDFRDRYAEKLYVYRTIAGQREDAPNSVWTC